MIKDGEKRGREHRKKDQKHLIRDKKTERERERERERLIGFQKNRGKDA